MDVIDVLKNGGNSLGPAAAIYEDCSFLCGNFSEVYFFHCPREANKTTHILASRSEGSQSIVWIKDPLDFIMDVITDDVALLPN
jgi:hypothetical protein